VVLVSRGSAVRVVYGGDAVGDWWCCPAAVDGGRHGLTIFSCVMEDAIYRTRDA
jgi:hypothetical protein